MEKIKVNMSPNPLDVQTIHASQNDGEAREWEFELHNNGELIDTSDVKEQLVFKAYKGGTEQLLPENGSTPTTSPFKGDIKYPQGLLSDQEFTYRQSPTEEDGNAKITDIKGNTIVWNQLVQNGNFADNSGWNFPNTSQSTTSISNNELSSAYVSGYPSVSQQVNIKKGHKFYLSFEFKASVNKNTSNGFFFYNSNNQSVLVTPLNYTTNYQKYEGVLSYDDFDLATIRIAYFEPSRWTAGDVISIKNVQIFDLTQMGLDITDPSEFTSLFSLPYYAYNQGSLLSFMGNGIKTVGFNQWDEEWEVGTISVNTGLNVNDSTRIRSKNYIHVFGGKQYYIHGARITFLEYDANKTFLRVGNNGSFLPTADTTFTPSADASYIRFYVVTTYGTTYNHDICINISDAERNGTYEPYTSSTLSLPISTYFPNGMKSAKNAYDEWTPIKASARIGAQTWNGTESFDVTNTRTNTIQFARGVSPSAKPTSADAVGNVVSNFFLPDSLNNVYSQDIEGIGIDTTGRIRVTILKSRLSSADASGFKSWLTSNNLTFCYELATPTETSFTTASLVTENAEIPLSNEDGTLIGKCTEELSAEPGFHDAKIKLTDADGECYSNKIQLHVERSPQ